jgi:hypothetical protein
MVVVASADPGAAGRDPAAVAEFEQRFAEAALDGAEVLGPDTPAGARLADTGRFLKHFGEDLLSRAEYWHAVVTGRGQMEA